MSFSAFAQNEKSRFERKMEFRKSEEKKFREELRRMKQNTSPTIPIIKKQL
jgi:hypothetical protein